MARAREPAAALLALALLGCGGRSLTVGGKGGGGSDATPSCQYLVGGVCAGVPPEPLCQDAYCTDGGTCGKIFPVASYAELAQAAADAHFDDCIALAPGSYPPILVKPGVSLFGASAAAVTIEGITGVSGAARLAGLTVGASGIALGGGVVSIDSVRMTLDPKLQKSAILGSGSVTLTLSRSEISGAGVYGVRVLAGKVTMDRTVVHDCKGPALWAGCNDGCKCAAPVKVAVTSSLLDHNGLVGMSLVAASAWLQNVEIRHTAVGANFNGGGGLALSQCSTMTALQLTAADNTDYGVLIDDSTATLDSIQVSGNLRGIWLQRIGKSQQSGAFRLNCGVLSGNTALGFGVDVGSRDVGLSSVTIADTKLVTVAVLKNGQAAMAQVGDGFAWGGLSQVNVDGLTVSNSARLGVLINGNVKDMSSLSNVTLAGGDEAKGMWQQNIGANAVSPALNAAPALQKSSGEQFPPVTTLGAP